MTTTAIVNGAPFTNLLGTDDVSTRTLVLEPEAIPSHLAKVYLYTQTGPVLPQLVVGDSRLLMYGEDSFDVRKKWATHATVLSNYIDAEANAQMIERMIPADAPPPANIRYCLDLLKAKVPEYKYNPDGSITVDETGAPVPTGEMIDGYIGKWVTEYIKPGLDGESTFGKGTQKPGDQTSAADATQSIRIPMWDVETPHVGEFGNNAGLRFWAPTASSGVPVDTRLIRDAMVYPLRASVLRRASVNVTPKVMVTTDAAQYVDLALQPGAFDTPTDSELYMGSEFIPRYQDLNNKNGAPPMWGAFGKIHMYDNNIESVLKQLYEAEVPYFNSFSDFDGTEGEHFRFNILGAVSSQDSPYYSFRLNTRAANAVRMTENSSSYATGGGDGKMNDSLFAELVKSAVEEYNNPNSFLMDMVRYPESHLYDSGFPLATKMALCNFIGRRKDTIVVLATHDVLGLTLNASQESALGVALRTRLQMFPESDYFGTEAMRGVIIGRSGILLNSRYKKRLPLSIELAAKSAAYMGASNGKWKSTKAFDESPLHMIDLFSDINITFTPMTVRNKDWDNGLVYVEHIGMRDVYWPAVKTVYGNDTSVLTGYFTVCAIAAIQKVANKARMKFSGNQKLTRAQLADRLNKEVIKETLNRFDDRYVIQPETYFTASDQARGYSYTQKIKVFAPNMMTVGTVSVEAHRMDDLATA